MSTASPMTESFRTAEPPVQVVPPIPQARALPESADSPPVVDGLPLYRLSVEQYRQMSRHGIIDDKAPVMLIHGLLVAKMGKNAPHVWSTNALTFLLNRALPEGWHISVQNPVALPAGTSEPEPDIAVVRGLYSDYPGRLAGPADAVLLIEVSESTLRADQTTMKAVYAAAGFLVYWIVNLIARRIEVYTDPTGPDPSPDYRRREEFGPGDSVPLVLDGREVARLAVAEILPPE